MSYGVALCVNLARYVYVCVILGEYVGFRALLRIPLSFSLCHVCV